MATARKKAPAKRAARKNATVKSTASKKTAPKKAAVGRSNKAPAKKAAAKKPVAKKQVAKKGATKRAVASRAGDDPRLQLDKLSPSAPIMASRGVAEAAAPAPRLPDEFYAAHKDEPLGTEAFAEAARALGCELAAIRAVAEVESRGSGFDAQGRPTILYERHVFSRNTTPKGKFDAKNPDISFSKPYPKGGFGTGEQQYVKLARAYELDPVAALMAPSWGIFQILGENYKACGFSDIKSYALAMFTSPAAHLRAFVAFVRADQRLHKALIARDWAAFARVYNGAGYKIYAYDEKIAAAYARYAGTP